MRSQTARSAIRYHQSSARTPMFPPSRIALKDYYFALGPADVVVIYAAAKPVQLLWESTTTTSNCRRPSATPAVSSGGRRWTSRPKPRGQSVDAAAHSILLPVYQLSFRGCLGRASCLHEMLPAIGFRAQCGLEPNLAPNRPRISADSLS